MPGVRWIGRKLKNLYHWFRRRPLVFQAVVIVILLFGLVGMVYGSYRGYDYTQNDPSFCRSCHIMEKAWTSWSVSAHRNLNCHACHEINPYEGAELILNWALNQPNRLSKHGLVSDDACAKCHENGNKDWPQIKGTAGHKVHVEEQNVGCTKCHGISIHVFTPPETICGVCHFDHVGTGAKALKIANMGSLHCYTCHNFLGKNNPLFPTRDTCLACHSKIPNKVTFPADAPMAWDCNKCHKPHDQAKPVVDCLSCHKDIPSKAAHALKTHSQSACTACHQPHEWKVSRRDNCLTCHPNKANHNPGYLCSDCHRFK